MSRPFICLVAGLQMNGRFIKKLRSQRGREKLSAQLVLEITVGWLYNLEGVEKYQNLNRSHRDICNQALDVNQECMAQNAHRILSAIQITF